MASRKLIEAEKALQAALAAGKMVAVSAAKQAYDAAKAEDDKEPADKDEDAETTTTTTTETSASEAPPAESTAPPPPDKAEGDDEDAEAEDMEDAKAALKSAQSRARKLTGKRKADEVIAALVGMVDKAHAKIADHRAERAVNAALKAGKITPAKRASALVSARRDPKGFAAMMDLMPVVASTEHARDPERAPAPEAGGNVVPLFKDPAHAQILGKLGLSPKAQASVADKLAQGAGPFPKF